jgi:hypothetical protein
VDMRPVLQLKSVDLTLLAVNREVYDSLLLELDSLFIDDVQDPLIGVKDVERLLRIVAYRIVLDVLTVCFKRDNLATRQLIDLLLCDFSGFDVVLLKLPDLFDVSSSRSEEHLLIVSADEVYFDHVFCLALFRPGLLLV